MNFETNTQTLASFFRQSSFVTIPFMQRSFAWSEIQINELWEDLKFSFSNDSSHFLGTIITNFNLRDSQIKEIIDGQQRISALFILHCVLIDTAFTFIKEKVPSESTQMNDALREFSEKLKQSEKLIQSYAENFIHTPFSMEAVSKPQLKIVPSWKDIKGYNYLIEESRFLNGLIEPMLDEHNEASKVITAYNFLEKKVRDYLFINKSSDSLQIISNLEKIIDKLHNKFIFVEVLVKDGEPNKIFDKLNTLGEPLSTLDVIRNSIFSDLGNNQNTQEGFNRLWMKFEKSLLEPFKGQINENNDKAVKASQMHIKGYWFPFVATFSTGANNRRLNYQLRELLDKNTDSSQEVLQRCKDKVTFLEQFVYLYNYLRTGFESEKFKKLPDEIKSELQRFYRLNCPNMIFPYLFNVINYYLKTDSKETKKDIINSFAYIESRMMRDAFTRQASQAPKDVFLPLYKNIKDYDHDFKLVRYFLENKNYPFQTDSDIKESMLNNQLYGVERVSYFFEELELEDKTPSKKSSFLKLTSKYDKYLQLDHFMPQDNKLWKDYLAKQNHRLSKKKYTEIVNNIGNLFLMHKSTNIQKGNKSFAEAKKIALSENDTKNVKYLDKCNQWNPKMITDRAEHLYKKFINRFPIYENYSKPDDNETSSLRSEIVQQNIKILNSCLLNKYSFSVVSLTKGKIERSDPTLTLELQNLLEDNNIINAFPKKPNSIDLSLKIIKDNVTLDTSMHIYAVRRNELLWSFPDFKDHLSPLDAIAFIVKEKTLYMINISNSLNLERDLSFI